MINIVLLIIIILIIFSLIYLVNNRCSNSCVEKMTGSSRCIFGTNFGNPCDTWEDCPCYDSDDEACATKRRCLPYPTSPTSTGKYCNIGVKINESCGNNMIPEVECPCFTDDKACSELSIYDRCISM